MIDHDLHCLRNPQGHCCCCCCCWIVCCSHFSSPTARNEKWGISFPSLGTIAPPVPENLYFFFWFRDGQFAMCSFHRLPGFQSRQYQSIMNHWAYHRKPREIWVWFRRGRM
ncbi:hypothetical protein BO86DRAFT_234160 [Aspergillus japonicus CBS 114.51]|uniref:Uncharacterized protein n=1 Tax=Aspergillus japonicus CBS 114.51 TaxID=1448312 RepID=A0A8T8WMU7_ASPJA|nr:hypothetical protein BO86DRAFT_234160 [Aspergillus japonicus CBS 114.51]RAH77014.1 hypothetical protein BO86DRAFT_234160 [Aspergillus japonicus CBS 114.51]